MVAGHQHDLAVRAERAAEVREHRPGDLGRLAVRRLAQLEAVAEDHEPVDASRAPRAAARAARAGAAGRRAWASRGAGRRSRACARAGRLASGRDARPARLAGLLVADFSRVLAGPYASMLLGDLGADVVKVERPDGGDDTRAWGPPWRGDGRHLLPGPQPQQALGDARPGRRGRPRARAHARRARRRDDRELPAGPDGEVGARRRLAARGATRARSRARSPRSAAASTARGMPGYDFLLQAMGGLMSVTGEEDGRPLKVGAAVVDLVCGLLATIGIQAALVERDADRARAPRRGLADGLRARPAAQPGHGLAARGRCRAGAATATRASPRTRPTRRPTARSPSRSATTACSRACARRSARRSWRRRALRDERRRGSRTRTRWPSAWRRRSASGRPTHWVRACARLPSRSGRSTTSPRPGRWPRSSAYSRSPRPTACRCRRRRCASTASARRSRGARRASTSTATTSAPGCARLTLRAALRRHLRAGSSSAA